MSTTSRFCSHCGAANAIENQVCFACQFPLAPQNEFMQQILVGGRYQLLTQVGAGGFGGVYRAIDTSEAMRRIVAVKQIKLRGLSTQEVIEATDSFNREVRLLTPLHHPNLTRIHTTFTDQENWYLVMDFIEGQTLEEYLKGHPESRLSLKETLEIGLQLCDVLDYLHKRHPAIIFRDLKPGNVMYTTGGHIYLIDFGIARHFSPGKPTDTIPFGSPGYAAPEQYGRAQTTPQADIYSLGALLHHLLTGDDPAENPFHFAPLPFAASIELDLLLQRMVAMEPGERPINIIEVKTILRKIQNQANLIPRPTLDPVRPAPAQAPTSRGRISRRTILAVSGTIIGVGGVIGLCSLATSSLYPRRFYGVQALPLPSPGVAKHQFVYRGHKGPITALSWSPDGTMVASGSSDGTVQVWRAADGALLYTLSGYTDAVTSIVWATDRTNVIASAGNDDGTVQVWDALRDHRDLIYHGDGRVLALDWKHTSPWMVSGGTDDHIYIWNASTGAKGASYGGHKGNVNTVMWLPDTTAFDNPNFRPAMLSTDMPTPVITPIMPTPTPTSVPTILTPTPAITPIIPTPTPTNVPILRQVIASGGADGTVQLWDASNGQNLFTYKGHTAAVNGLVYLSDQTNQTPGSIVSASDDGTVQRWNMVSGTLLETYRGHVVGKVNAIALPPRPLNSAYSGSPAASAGEDHTVQVWMLQNSAPICVYRGHLAPIKALAASPIDNRMVSGDTNGQVHLWTITYPSYK